MNKEDLNPEPRIILEREQIHINQLRVHEVLDVLEKHKEIPNAYLVISPHMSYDDPYSEVHVEYERRETEQEVKARLQSAKNQCAISELQEKNKLRELLKKYPEFAK